MSGYNTLEHEQIKTEKYTGFYRGIVVDDEDPDEGGRIKVRVHPMFSSEDIKDEDLPWAVPADAIIQGAAIDEGAVTIPHVDSHVFIFFEDGDIYQPVYFAAARSISTEPDGPKRGSYS